MTAKKLENAPTCMTELIRDLADLYYEARNGLLKPEFVKQAANVAGKMIKGASSLTEYAIARKEKPEIQFMK